MDITYIPMERGFASLAAVVDWFSRCVLAWRLSITMAVDFCLEAVEEALAKYGRAEIFNTDQGSQSRARPSPVCCWRTRSPSVWMVVVLGETMSLLSVYGDLSSTRKSTCELTKVLMTPVLRSADIWISTIANGRIRALMLDRRITPTSTTRRSQRQHEFRRRCGSLLCLGYALLAQQPTTVYTEPIGRRSTYRRRNAVSSRPSTSVPVIARSPAPYEILIGAAEVTDRPHVGNGDRLQERIRFQLPLQH